MKNTLLHTLIAGLVGTAAIAGSPEPYIEEVYPDPLPVDAPWDGAYGGLVGGLQSGEITPGAFTFDETTYGVLAGYNLQMGDVVVGGELAAQIGEIDFPPSYDIDMLVDAKVRLGYSFGDALIFASGGYSTFGSTDFGFAANGWNAGAGIDYAVTERFFVGGEYVYRNLENTAPGGFDYSSHGGQFRAGIKF